MLKTGWKVVYLKDDEKESFWMGVGEGCVKYSFDQWTIPLVNHGPLCVFKTKEDALDYLFPLTIFDEDNIFRCLYVSSEEKCIYNEYKMQDETTFPKGTILASSVKLLKK